MTDLFSDAPRQIARVALDTPVGDLFDYALPSADGAVVGKRVMVPFGPRKMAGVIVELTDRTDIPDSKLRTVQKIFEDMPPLPADALALLKACASYYHHPLGEVIFNALPTPLRQPKDATIKFETRLELTEAGHAVQDADLPPRAQVARRLLAHLRHSGACSRAQLRQLSDRAPAIAAEWLERGWLKEVVALPALGAGTGEAPLPLNAEQQAALEQIRAGLGQFKPWLLHGITGSGKTEIYMQLIREVIDGGGQALVLVPEINLTPQLEGRFAARFKDVQLVSLHSRLTALNRQKNWLAAQSGDAAIVLGTRLAVFTPMKNLRLIIVDEEHDGSFKQQDGLRYSARDVAVMRAHQQNVPVVLGSATPSLETFQNARAQRYGLLPLTQRAVSSAELPTIAVVDVRHQPLQHGLSDAARNELARTLGRGEQAMVFLNRRGYSPVLFCIQCGWTAACTRCSARMVLHLRNRHMRCHHCGAQQAIPRSCPSCGEIDLRPVGLGTQRLETHLAELFPDARIERVDRDSTSGRDDMADIIRRVHNREVDMLVGTQMLAKGHDFPNLTLVVALDVDGGLLSPDFRASERLFAQLMQVAGRAGRARLPGRVLIQTQCPAHPVFAALTRHDYTSFAHSVLDERKLACFPPFSHQALLRAEAPHVQTALDFLDAAAQLCPASGQVTLFDPVPAQMVRLKNLERAQLLIESAHRPALHGVLRAWLPAIRSMRPAPGLRWHLDVDPVDF